MKLILLVTAALFSTATLADEKLIGNWVDKGKPNKYKFIFAQDNDFKFEYKYKQNYKEKTGVNVGVWEVGSWTITSPNKSEKSCKLQIYADSQECCFAYKFVGKNLILTNEYRTQSYSSMCNNRVLVREK